MAALDIDYEGKSYILDIEDMDTEEARAMERFGVKNLKAFEEGISEGDLSCLTVAFWLMVRQTDGADVRLERVAFKPVKFIKALGEASQKAAENAEDDPKAAE